MKAKCDKCNEKLRKDVNRTKEQKKLILYCPVCKRNYTAQSAFHVYKTPKSEKIKKAKEKKADEIIENAKKEASEIVRGAIQRAENLIKNNLQEYFAGKRDSLIDDINKFYYVDLNKLETSVYTRAFEIYNYLNKTIDLIEKFELKVNKTSFINAKKFIEDYLNN